MVLKLSSVTIIAIVLCVGCSNAEPKTVQDRVFGKFKQEISSLFKDPKSVQFWELEITDVLLPNVGPLKGEGKGYYVNAQVSGTDVFGGAVSELFIGTFSEKGETLYFGELKNMSQFMSDADNKRFVVNQEALTPRSDKVTPAHCAGQTLPSTARRCLAVLQRRRSRFTGAIFTGQVGSCPTWRRRGGPRWARPRPGRWPSHTNTYAPPGWSRPGRSR